MNDNYLALAVSILAKCPPERAFVLLANGKASTRDYRIDITEADTKDMIKMREQGLTWPQIGEIYGISHYSAFRKVKSYLKRKKGA